MKLGKRMFLLLAVAVLVISGCTSNNTDTQPSSSGQETETSDSKVKIGVILPLSGSAASLGEMSKRGMELAVEEINANGGVKSLNGAKLELVFGDSQGKPQVGVSEAERLITQENVPIITGAYQSGVTLPASEVAERYKKIWLASVPSEVSITERGFK